MPPLTYILDGECMRVRIATTLAVGLGVLVTLVGILVPVLALPGDVWQMALLAVTLLLGVVAPIFARAQDTEAWLRLDGEGVTLKRRGRQVRWSWSGLSGLRLRSIFHPATLVFGHCITFRAPVDGRQPPFGWLARWLFGEGMVVIGNDYFTESEVIAERLEAYSAAAAQGAPARLFRRGDDISIPPHIFRARPIRPRWRRAARILLRLLGAAVAGLFVALPIVVKELTGDWTWSDLAAHAGEFAAITVVATLVVGTALYVGARNFLILSDDGLHLWRRGQHRLWPWHFVAPFELRAADGRKGAAIVFKAIGEGEEDSQGKLDPEEREELLNGTGDDDILVPVTIEDVYERPLAEILGALEAYRARALQAGKPATAG